MWSGCLARCGVGNVDLYGSDVRDSPDQYEAAYLDGASRLQCIRHITIPFSIMPTIVTLPNEMWRQEAFLSVALRRLFLLQNAANLASSEVLSTYTYKMGS